MESLGEVGAPLDDVDRALLDLLQQDGRASYAQLGKAGGISADVARSRLLRMYEQNIYRVHGVSDARLFGRFFFAFLVIRIGGSAKPVIEHLASRPEVGFLASCAGGADLIAEVSCLDPGAFADFLEDHVRPLESVAECTSHVALTFKKFEPANRVAPKRQRDVVMSTRPSSDEVTAMESLSAEDLALMRALAEDGRLSFQDLAEATGTSYPTARRRALKLIENGTVEIVTVVNRGELGTKLSASLTMSFAGDVGNALRNVSQIDQVELLAQNAGPSHAMAVVACRDTQELVEVINERLPTCGDLIRIEVFPWLRLHKIGTSYRLTTDV